MCFFSHTAAAMHQRMNCFDSSFFIFFIPVHLFHDLHAKVAAVIAAPQRFCSMPNELRMQTGVADVIAVAKAAAQLRTAVFYAGVVIGTFHHVNTPYTVADLQLL